MLNQQPRSNEKIGYAAKRAEVNKDRVAAALLERLAIEAQDLVVESIAGELGGYVVMATVPDNLVPTLASINPGIFEMKINPYGTEMRVVYGVRCEDMSEGIREKYQEFAR